MLAHEARRRPLHLSRRRGLLRPQRTRGRRGRRRACSRRRPDCRCACNGCAPTSMAGIRKDRRRCSTSARRSTSSGNVLAWESEAVHSGPAEGHRGHAAAGGARQPPARGSASRQHPSSAGDSIHDSRTSRRPRIGSPKRRFVRHGSARRDGCRTRSATRASSTRSRRPRAWIPLEFRIKNLKDPRGAELLQRLAKLADWQTAWRTPDDERRRRRAGAASRTSSTSWCVPTSARWPMSRSTATTGKVTVKKFYVAHDCGQIINPDGLRNQIEGNVVQTVSRTLIEDLQFDRATVTSIDWVTLSDSHVSRRAGRCDRADRPPDRKTLGRRRADGRAWCRRQSPTRSSMRPARVCVRCRSRPKKCWPR